MRTSTHFPPDCMPWIEKLFDDPLDAEPSWPALHKVVRDPRAMDPALTSFTS
jgi:hypothetical protein